MNNKRLETSKKYELNVFANALSCIYISCKKSVHTSFSQAGSKLLSLYKTILGEDFANESVSDLVKINLLAIAVSLTIFFLIGCVQLVNFLLT